MVGDHIGNFEDGDLVFMGPLLPHVWVNDLDFENGKMDYLADGIVVQFVENFMGEKFMQIPELESLYHILELSNRGLAIKGKVRDEINSIMIKMLSANGLQRLSYLLNIFDILSRITEAEYDVLASPRSVEILILKFLTVSTKSMNIFSAIFMKTSHYMKLQV
jgi:hypothetical protein